ncbi:MAG: hypothetical protein DI529_05375 [Chryseobacterium sp.]|nr:MAG: hypothetical protein DI529_05375 [Chryseobacterium sp.]
MGDNQNTDRKGMENSEQFSEPISALIDHKKAVVVGVEDLKSYINLPALASVASFLLIGNIDKLSKMVKEEKTMDTALQEKIQDYINVYRNISSSFLEPNVGQRIKIVGFEDGVVLEIESKPKLSNSDHFFNEVDTIEMAFSLLQREPTPAAMKFKTPFNDTSIEVGESIFIIKGKEEHFWTMQQAYFDMDAIIDVIEKVIEKKEKTNLKKSLKNKGNERTS